MTLPCPKCGRNPTPQIRADENARGVYVYDARLACRGWLGLWAHVAAPWLPFITDGDRKGERPRMDMLKSEWNRHVMRLL